MITVNLAKCYFNKPKLSYNVNVFHLCNYQPLMFCSFLKRTPFTVVTAKGFHGSKPVCPSINNVSICVESLKIIKKYFIENI